MRRPPCRRRSIIYRGRNDAFATAPLELARGQALLRAGQPADAEAAFLSGIAAAEHERRGVSTDADRVSALSARWDLYAWLADLRLRRDEQAALDTLRAARAVNLDERLNIPVRRAAFTPPAGTIAVEFAVLPSGVHAWLSAGPRRERYAVASSLPALTDAVDRFRAAILRRDAQAAIDRRARALFTTLFGPIAGDIAGAERLVIVPDGPLHDVPFAALEDPATGQFLVEHAAVVVTPSLAFYARPTAGAPPGSSPLAALVVGNPDRAAAGDDRLPSLAASAEEAQAVAALYAPVSLVVGPRATRRSFLENVARARVVHFAGHALVSEQRPELSRLLLAPTADDPLGAVFASDIEGRSLDRVRLVVLSACDTARGRLARGEGVVGLVRAFLTAGVPSVAATLWPVDDRTTAMLFSAFHRAWARGVGSADALREAQLELQRSGRAAVVDWAGAVLIGRSVTP